mgnify:CR=1 FL=1
MEGKSDVFTLAVGDCFNDEAGEVITAVKVLKCTEPHDNELYYEYSLPNDFFGSESYSQDKIYTDAEEKCFPEFESFIGSSFDDTALNFSPGNCAGQRNNKIWIIIVRVTLSGTKVNHLISGRAQLSGQMLL